MTPPSQSIRVTVLLVSPAHLTSTPVPSTHLAPIRSERIHVLDARTVCEGPVEYRKGTQFCHGRVRHLGTVEQLGEHGRARLREELEAKAVQGVGVCGGVREVEA
ncbi:hypothetical protein C8Q78DRAFT_749052 [Trametes maxima]|nr:hypothetical protein C8Q78DRAFT_749052 [Trametes maxima]